MGSIALTSFARVVRRGLVLGLSVVVGCVGVSGVRAVAAADEVRGEQWQLSALDARDAWKVSTGKGVVVAVIDSGVDGTHPDLAGQVLTGIDLVEPGAGDGGNVDPVGHGTTVAGLIAGSSKDSAGVEGIAPEAKILPIRVLDKANKYDDPAIVARAVRWGVDHGASVINLSLGGALRSDAIAEALGYAAAHDVVVVACTGNVATDPSTHEVWYPAREPGVVAVAGLGGEGPGSSGALWTGSLTGPETVLTAPAVNLTGAKPGGGYWQVQGTSFAAPLVAGAASLIRARYPHMSAANVINRLIGTAKDLGPVGRDDEFGFGEVDPVAALRGEHLTDVAANPLAAAVPRPRTDGGSVAAGDKGDVRVEGAAPPRKGGAAPLPVSSSASDDAGLERLAVGERAETSAVTGLLAMTLIMAAGAFAVLLRHRRQAKRPPTL